MLSLPQKVEGQNATFDNYNFTFNGLAKNQRKNPKKWRKSTNKKTLGECGGCFLDVDSEGCCREEHYSRDSAGTRVIVWRRRMGLGVCPSCCELCVEKPFTPRNVTWHLWALPLPCAWCVSAGIIHTPHKATSILIRQGLCLWLWMYTVLAWLAVVDSASCTSLPPCCMTFPGKTWINVYSFQIGHWWQKKDMSSKWWPLDSSKAFVSCF